MTQQITKKAQESLQKLIAMRDANGGQFPLSTYRGGQYVATGLNTRVLWSLIKAEYIKVRGLYLGGRVQGLEILKESAE